MNRSGHQLLRPLTAYRLLALALVPVVLFVVSRLSVLDSPVWVAIMLVGLWWLYGSVVFWHARRRRALFLVHLRETSGVKTRLRGGLIMWLVCMLLSLPAAVALLVVLSQGLDLVLRVMLVVGIGGWLCADRWSRRLTRRHVRVHAAFYYRQNLTLFMVGVLLLGLLLVAAFCRPVPDVSALDFDGVLLLAQADVQARVPWLQTLAWFWVGLDDLFLWAVERFTAGESMLAVNLLVWAVYLVRDLFVVLSILLLYQGATLMAPKVARSFVGWSKRPRLSRVLALCLGICLVAVFVWDKAVPQPWVWLTGKMVVVADQGQVYRMTPDEWSDVVDRFDRRQAQWFDNRLDTFGPMDRQMDAAIDRLFDAAIARVPDYVDWYFSGHGKLQRVAAHLPLLPDVDDKLQQMLFPGGLEDRVQALAVEQNGALFGGAWQNESSALSMLSGLLSPYRAPRSRQAQLQPVAVNAKTLYGQGLSMAMLSGWRPAYEGAAAVGAGLSAAAVTWLRMTPAARPAGGGVRSSMTRATTGTGERAALAASRQSSQRASVRALETAGRWAARAAPKLAPGAVCGPAVLLCSAVSFAVITVGTEWALLRYDEYANRDDMTQHLVARLQSQRQRVKQAFRQQARAQIRAMRAHLRQTMDAVRVVRRDRTPLDWVGW